MSRGSADLDYGLNGQEIIVDTNPHPGSFYALHILAETTISAVEYTVPEDVTPDGTDWTDLGALAAGTVLRGRFSSITLASGGKAIAFKV